jgi:hypothetical protein
MRFENRRGPKKKKEKKVFVKAYFSSYYFFITPFLYISKMILKLKVVFP